MEAEAEEHPPTIIAAAKNPREAAYLAVLTSLREENFASEHLEKWRKSQSPSALDYSFAREIAYGSIRMALALDHIAEQLADKQKLKLKLREKVLLRTAIYQAYFMDKVPLYAITNETIDIAKKYCHQTFIGFLNAVLRRLSEEKPELPQGETIPEMSIRYSYPPYFVQEIVNDYGIEKAIAIMEAENQSSPTTFRVRSQTEKEMELLTGTLSPIAVLEDTQDLQEIANSSDYYIQNVTPAELMFLLSKDSNEPKRVLDLCASPGGKLLAIYDQFPNAALFANDISPKKLKALSENITKYGISATVTCSDGRQYVADEPFDLIIIDAPCSNSGVLNKRPEARWRISQKTIENQEQLQMQLLKHATSLLSEEGEIWYLTCSILKKENERLVDNVCEMQDLQIRMKETILPNLDGWDGGFACALCKK